MDKNLEFFSNLKVIKLKELEDCNNQLLNGEHTGTIRKALMVYRTEILECLKTYDYYLEKQEYVGGPN